MSTSDGVFRTTSTSANKNPSTSTTSANKNPSTTTRYVGKNPANKNLFVNKEVGPNAKSGAKDDVVRAGGKELGGTTGGKVVRRAGGKDESSLPNNKIGPSSIPSGGANKNSSNKGANSSSNGLGGNRGKPSAAKKTEVAPPRLPRGGASSAKNKAGVAGHHSENNENFVPGATSSGQLSNPGSFVPGATSSGQRLPGATSSGGSLQRSNASSGALQRGKATTVNKNSAVNKNSVNKNSAVNKNYVNKNSSVNNNSKRLRNLFESDEAESDEGALSGVAPRPAKLRRVKPKIAI